MSFDFLAKPCLLDSPLAETQKDSLKGWSRARLRAVLLSFAAESREFSAQLDQEILTEYYYYTRVRMIDNNKWQDYVHDIATVKQVARDVILAGADKKEKTRDETTLECLAKVLQHGAQKLCAIGAKEEIEAYYSELKPLVSEGLRFLKLKLANEENDEERIKLASMPRLFPWFPLLEWLEIFEGDCFEEEVKLYKELGQPRLLPLYTSTYKSTATFNSFPPEIIHLILKLAIEFIPALDFLRTGSEYGTSCISLATKTLVASSELCRSWSGPARSELFARGFIHSPRGLERFTELMTFRDDWSSVKSITIDFRPYPYQTDVYSNLFCQFIKLATSLSIIEFRGRIAAGELVPPRFVATLDNLRTYTFNESVKSPTLSFNNIDFKGCTNLFVPNGTVKLEFIGCQFYSENVFARTLTLKQVTVRSCNLSRSGNGFDFQNSFPFPNVDSLIVDVYTGLVNLPTSFPKVKYLQLLGRLDEELTLPLSRFTNQFQEHRMKREEDFLRPLTLFTHLKKVRVTQLGVQTERNSAWSIDGSRLEFHAKEMGVELVARD